MDIPTLRWFSQCAEADPFAPASIKALGKKIPNSFFEPNALVTISRAFKKAGVTGTQIRTWMANSAYQQTPEVATLSIKCAAAFDLMDKGTPVSVAWGLCGTRGPKTGLSKTLGAAAIANQLSALKGSSALPDDLFGNENISGEELLARVVLTSSDVEEPLFSKAQALEHAAKISGVRKDEVKKYSGITPGSSHDEANMALSEILKAGQKSYASRLVDLQDLKDAGKRL